MADATIGSLRVVLGADTAAFSDGLKKAGSDLEKFGANFNLIGAAITGALAGAVAGLGVAVAKTIKEADDLGKAAQKFGIPVEQLSAIKFAADLADVSFESLGKGLGKLSKAMLDGAINPSGEAAKGFKALGISVRDSSGQMKTTEDVFNDVAKKFSTMEDGAAKTALAIKLFGRSGADLIPLLNQGADGIKSLTDRAKALGIVVSGETAAAAEKFNDTLKDIHAASGALYLRIAESLLPSLQAIADLFVSSGQRGSAFQSIIQNLITQDDVNQVRQFVVYWTNLVAVFTALKAIGVAKTFDELKDALNKLDAVVVENQKRLDEFNRSLLSLGKAGAFDSLDNLNQLMEKVKRGFTTVNEEALKAKTALDSFLDSQRKAIAARIAEADSIGKAVGFKERWQAITEANTIAQNNNITISTAQRAAIEAVGNAAAAAAQKLSDAQMVQDALPQWALYEQQLNRINDALKRGGINADQAAILSRKAAEQTGQAWDIAASSITGSFASAFQNFGKTNEGMFKIGQAFGIAQAIINTYTAASKALATYPPPLSYVAAAAAIAQGLGYVASIRAQKFQGAAFGGSFKVPGGISSVDTKLVPMMLAPGERVDVTPASRASDGESRELIIPSIKPKDFFTGDVVREMVTAIDLWMKDGGTGIRISAR